MTSISKSVAFVPYCCKPLDCPVGRKNQKCLKFSKGCTKDCSIGKLDIDSAEFFIIDKDENLLKWLEQKYKYYYPGCGCEYGYEKVKDVIKFTGKVVFICGDVCDKEEEYQEMENKDKGKVTYIPEDVIDSL